MSRTRSKKKKANTNSGKAATPSRAKKGKPKTHVPREDKKKKKPPWVIPVLVFVGLLAFVALALIASSATPTQ